MPDTFLTDKFLVRKRMHLRCAKYIGLVYDISWCLLSIHGNLILELIHGLPYNSIEPNTLFHDNPQVTLATTYNATHCAIPVTDTGSGAIGSESVVNTDPLPLHRNCGD